jgi:hypothetical protein
VFAKKTFSSRIIIEWSSWLHIKVVVSSTCEVVGSHPCQILLSKLYCEWWVWLFRKLYINIFNQHTFDWLWVKFDEKSLLKNSDIFSTQKEKKTPRCLQQDFALKTNWLLTTTKSFWTKLQSLYQSIMIFSPPGKTDFAQSLLENNARASSLQATGCFF